MFQLLKTEFPEEETILGTRLEGFEQLIRRLYRWDLRFVLGMMGLFHRSPFHLYVVEEDAAIAGTTLLSFAAKTGFLSTVVVAPAFRRRGFARQMLEAARKETARRRRPYVALRVLQSNTPARSLYASLGFTELDRQAFVVCDGPFAFPPEEADPAIRPFQPTDAGPLSELSNRLAPEEVRRVLPVAPHDLRGGSWADRLFAAQSASWVVDRGRGPEAHVGATSTPMTDAGHLSCPIVGPSVEPALAASLIRVAAAWLAVRRPARIVTSIAETNERAHRALQEAGFHDAFPHLTLYRPTT